METTLKTQEVEEAPTAAEIMIEFEEGRTAAGEAMVQRLTQPEFIRVLRTLQRMEDALTAYGMSWKHSEYWGRGVDFPDQAKAA